MTPSGAAGQSWWSVADGDWHTAANWSPSMVPGAFDAAWINNGGTAHLSNVGMAFVVTIGSFSGGSGALELTDTGTLTAESLVIGYQNGSTGQVSLDGSNAHLSSYDVYVGDRGNGTLMLVNGGTFATQANAAIGNQAGSIGTATVDGNGSTWSSPGMAFQVGVGGTGLLNVSNGGRVESGAASVGVNVGAMGTVEVADPLSSWLVGGNLTVGDAGGVGRLAIAAGGAVETTGDVWIGNVAADGEVTLETAGSPDPLNLYSQWVTRDLAVGQLGAGRLNILSGSKVTSRNSMIGGSGSSSLGRAVVSGDGSRWTSTGLLTVGSTGELSIGENAVVAAGGDISVTPGGRVEGSGTVLGNVTNGGTIAPGGASIDALLVDGDLSQSAAGILDLQLGSALSHDKLNVTGALALNGTLQVTLVDEFTPALNDVFDLMDWNELPGELTGTFTALNLPRLPAGLSWSSAGLYTDGTLEVVLGPEGDFNSNGVVDAADYVLWRKENGTPQAYDIWRMNFGNSVGGGGTSTGGFQFGSQPEAAVPEPASIATGLLGAIVLVVFGRTTREFAPPPSSDRKTLPEMRDVG